MRVRKSTWPLSLMAAAVGVWVTLPAAGADDPRPGAPPDFWKHWGDGRAELNGYRLTQPRYGAPRSGVAVLVYVTEDMSDSLRVKADPGKHPESDVYPVLKLNEVRDFQTGIYDYNVMTSVFARVMAGWPVEKISFSSQEWCGQVYHQILPRAGRLAGVLHSYFDGEADGTEDLSIPEDAVYGDALPILVRGWKGAFLGPGEKHRISLLPRLLVARLDHRPLAWEQAEIARSSGTTRLTVPAGSFVVTTYTLTLTDGGPGRTYSVEAVPPFRLVRWTGPNGELGELLGSERLAYWKLNAPGGESHLKRLGLRPLSAPR